MRGFLCLFLVNVLFWSIPGSAQILRDDQSVGADGKKSGGAALTGVLKEAYDITKPVPWAKIVLKGTDNVTYADGRGFFVIKGVTAGGAAVLMISADGFETRELDVLIGGGEELGVIYLNELRRDLFPITVTDLMPSQPDNQHQSLQLIGAAALWNSTETLINASNLSLGMLGFKPRGYDWRSTSVYVNGAAVNEQDRGYAIMSLWAGMNSLTSKGEGSSRILSDLPFFNDIGGASHLKINPLEYRKQFKVSYSFSNALYANKVNVEFNSGVMPSGWAFSVLASGREGKSGTKGSHYQGYSYLFSAGKEIDESNYFTFYLSGAPTDRGTQTYITKSEQDKYGVDYNPSWGTRNGSQRNARVHNAHIPMLGIMHSWDRYESAVLRTSLNLSAGKSGYTDLNWTANQSNPWPNGSDSVNFALNKEPQLNWDQMYAVNDSLQQAAYIVERAVQDRSMLNFNIVYDIYDWGNLAAAFGLEARLWRSNIYKQVDDLMGANYWLDVDKFAPGFTPPPNYTINNIDFPNAQLTEGARIGYNYTIEHQEYKIFSTLRYYYEKFKITFGAQAAYTSFNRSASIYSGKIKPEDEVGGDHRFFSYGFKTGIAYKINKRSDVELNTLQSSRAPLFTDVFLAPQISNARAATQLKSEQVMGMELNYTYTTSTIDFKLSSFFTRFQNQIRTRSYFDPIINSVLNLSLSELNQQHFGVDLSSKISLSKTISARAGGAFGVYKYRSDPKATLYQQNLNHKLIDAKQVNMNGLKVGSTPQLAFTAGLLYDSPMRWWVGFNANFVSGSYAEVNPIVYLATPLQTKSEEEGGGEVVEEEPNYLDQEKLLASTTFDLYGGYTYEFGNRKVKALGLNINIQNITNNRGHLGAYQPFGIVDVKQNVANTKYAYILGRSLFVTVSFRF